MCLDNDGGPLRCMHMGISEKMMHMQIHLLNTKPHCSAHAQVSRSWIGHIIKFLDKS